MSKSLKIHFENESGRLACGIDPWNVCSYSCTSKVNMVTCGNCLAVLKSRGKLNFTKAKKINHNCVSIPIRDSYGDDTRVPLDGILKELRGRGFVITDPLENTDEPKKTYTMDFSSLENRYCSEAQITMEEIGDQLFQMIIEHNGQQMVIEGLEQYSDIDYMWRVLKCCSEGDDQSECWDNDDW